MGYQKKLDFIMEYTRLKIDQSVPNFIYENEALALIAEIERLRQQNAELVYAVKWIVTEDERSDPFRMACAIDHAKEVIAKATGGE